MHTVIRVLWFVTFGWWVGTLWLVAAILFSVSIIFMPIGIVMAQKTWAVTTLKTSPDVVVKEVKVEADSQ